MKSDICDIVENALGHHIGIKECIRLIKSNDVVALGAVANVLRQKLYGNTASFINNIILNYTNVCVTYCKFCAFYRPPGHQDAYTLSKEEVLKRVLTSAQTLGTTQVLIQGGHNPSLRLEYFESVFNAIKKSSEIAIHGLSPSEVDMIAKIERSSTKEVSPD